MVFTGYWDYVFVSVTEQYGQIIFVMDQIMVFAQFTKP